MKNIALNQGWGIWLASRTLGFVLSGCVRSQDCNYVVVSAVSMLVVTACAWVHKLNDVQKV